jgi:hypothetical protein
MAFLESFSFGSKSVGCIWFSSMCEVVGKGSFPETGNEINTKNHAEQFIYKVLITLKGYL